MAFTGIGGDLSWICGDFLLSLSAFIITPQMLLTDNLKLFCQLSTVPQYARNFVTTGLLLCADNMSFVSYWITDWVMTKMVLTIV